MDVGQSLKTADPGVFRELLLCWLQKDNAQALENELLFPHDFSNVVQWEKCYVRCLSAIHQSECGRLGKCAYHAPTWSMLQREGQMSGFRASLLSSKGGIFFVESSRYFVAIKNCSLVDWLYTERDEIFIKVISLLCTGEHGVILCCASGQQYFCWCIYVCRCY